MNWRSNDVKWCHLMTEAKLAEEAEAFRGWWTASGIIRDVVCMWMQRCLLLLAQQIYHVIFFWFSNSLSSQTWAAAMGLPIAGTCTNMRDIRPDKMNQAKACKSMFYILHHLWPICLTFHCTAPWTEMSAFGPWVSGSSCKGLAAKCTSWNPRRQNKYFPSYWDHTVIIQYDVVRHGVTEMLAPQVAWFSLPSQTVSGHVWPHRPTKRLQLSSCSQMYPRHGATHSPKKRSERHLMNSHSNEEVHIFLTSAIIPVDNWSITATCRQHPKT